MRHRSIAGAAGRVRSPDMAIPLARPVEPDPPIPDHAKRLLTRSRSALTAVINEEPGDPVPTLTVGILARLCEDINAALAQP